MNKSELKTQLLIKIKNSATTYEALFHAMSALIDILVEDNVAVDNGVLQIDNAKEANASN